MKIPSLTWKIPELQVIKSKEICSEHFAMYPCLPQVSATSGSPRLLQFKYCAYKTPSIKMLTRIYNL